MIKSPLILGASGAVIGMIMTIPWFATGLAIATTYHKAQLEFGLVAILVWVIAIIASFLASLYQKDGAIIMIYSGIAGVICLGVIGILPLILLFTGSVITLVSIYGFKRREVRRIEWLSMIGVAGIFISSIIIVAIYFIPQSEILPTNVAGLQLDAMKIRDFNKAYSYCSKGLRQELSRSQFEEYYAGRLQIMDYENVKLTQNIGERQAVVEMSFDYGKRARSYGKYRFVNENGQWKISNMSLLPQR